MTKKNRLENDGTEELNLVPIMNLVVCLIPIILFGTVMVKVGVINVNAPRFGPKVSQKVIDEPPLNLTVGIGNDGFRLKAGGVDVSTLLSEEGIPNNNGVIPKRGDEFDYVTLYNALMAIKISHPDETLVTISADPKTPYKVLVRTMDNVRFQLEEESYPNAEQYAAAAVRQEDGKRALLWPDVAFAAVN